MDGQIQDVGIVGAGLIGAGWAAFYASKGLAVKLYDADGSACRQGHATAVEYLHFLRDHGVISRPDCDGAVAGLEIAESMPAAVAGADLIQESVAERYDVKNDVLRQVDEHTRPDAIIASSSSGLLISELQKVMAHPERSLIAHPFNPPHLVPLVELVPGTQTAESTISRMKAFFEGMGKAPVVLNMEVPGHIANRLQAAVWREAIDIVLRGIASVADVDRALSAGPGIRWALLGQHMIFHLGGGAGGTEHFMDHVGASWQALWKDMATWTSLPAESKAVIGRGVRQAMGDKTAAQIQQWRDEKLVEVLRLTSE